MVSPALRGRVMTKTALRAQLRRLRRRLAAEVPDAAERVVARLGQDSLPDRKSVV